MSAETFVSVIIPTFNRAHVLKKTLSGYAKQSGDHQICEVLVVDDGSKDDTASVVQEWNGNPILNVRYLRQENRGLAAARNHAIREARGDILLFGDDDIIPSNKMVAEHLAWHRNHPQANVGVVGLVNWAAEMNATPFMAWSGLYGPQFNFGYFKEAEELDFWHGYFCNTSVKASFLQENGVFNENFRQYGWEDVELSYRLCTHGYRLLYNPKAVGYHHKFESFENTRRRIEILYSTWPMFAATDAGKRFLELRSTGRQGAAGRSKSMLRKALKPVKLAVVLLMRPLMDTRIPFPNWLYGQVFYHHVTPFEKFLNPSGEPPSSGAE